MRRPDYTLIAIIVILILFGLVMLSSASSVVAWEKFRDSFYFVKRQLIYGIFPGILFLIGLSSVDYRKFRKYVLPIFTFSLFLLFLVFIPGIGESYGRAQSWITFGGTAFQPSEFAKLTFFIYLAAWLASRRQAGEIKSSFVPFLVLLSVMGLLLIAQPDVGTMTLIVLSAFIVYFIAGGGIGQLLSLGVAGLLFLFFLIRTAPYRAQRLMVFLNPELDPQGIGYHINQALLAIGSGGILGKGLGLSRQKFLYLPEVISDSIFAVIAEELGFLMVVGLIGLFLLFTIRGLTIAKGAPDLFGKLLATGITSWVIIQAFANIGSMVGILPLTGLPLPFISYGGSAMTALLAACGILISISRYSSTKS